MRLIYTYLICLFAVIIYFNHSYSQELQITRNGNLRAGPSTTHEIIGKVNVGMKVTQIERAQNWYKVILANQNIGWIHKILITKVESSNDEESEYIAQIVQDCILLASLPQYSWRFSNIFNKTDNRKLYAKLTLVFLVEKYKIGEPKGGFITPAGVEAEFNSNFFIFVSKFAEDGGVVDPIPIIYSDRGDFPQVEIGTKYDIQLLNPDDEIVEDDQLVAGAKVRYEEGMRAIVKGKKWIYKKGRWVKT